MPLIGSGVVASQNRLGQDYLAALGLCRRGVDFVVTGASVERQIRAPDIGAIDEVLPGPAGKLRRMCRPGGSRLERGEVGLTSCIRGATAISADIAALLGIGYHMRASLVSRALLRAQIFRGQSFGSGR